MNKNEFNKGIGDLKEIRMTSQEKNNVMNNIMKTFPAPEVAKKDSIKSPWTVYSFNMWITQHRWAYAAILLLVVSLAGGSVVSAAGGSLPGDVLYSIKVHVSEPVRVALAGNPQGKAELAVEFADERMKEGEALASQGRLDEGKQKELSDLMVEHTQSLNTALLSVAPSDDSSKNESEKIRSDFSEKMNKHADNLEQIATGNDEDKVGESEDKGGETEARPSKTVSVPAVSRMMSVPAAPSSTMVNHSDKKIKDRGNNPIFKLADSARASRDVVNKRGQND